MSEGAAPGGRPLFVCQVQLNGTSSIRDLPSWPAKLTRDQQRAVKQRNRDFAGARSGEWRFARGTLFRRSGAWCIDALPWPAWQRGAVVRLTVKAMTLDPLFRDIVGLQDNEKLPLSFRATVRGPATAIDRDRRRFDEEAIEALAAEVPAAAAARSDELLRSLSIPSLLATLPPADALCGSRVPFYLPAYPCRRS